MGSKIAVRIERILACHYMVDEALFTVVNQSDAKLCPRCHYHSRRERDTESWWTRIETWDEKWAHKCQQMTQMDWYYDCSPRKYNKRDTWIWSMRCPSVFNTTIQMTQPVCSEYPATFLDGNGAVVDEKLSCFFIPLVPICEIRGSDLCAADLSHR